MAKRREQIHNYAEVSRRTAAGIAAITMRKVEVLGKHTSGITVTNKQNKIIFCVLTPRAAPQPLPQTCFISIART